ncbi:anhydro-N-acetylmuramic acid kinase-like [Tubulanus polymorphus]|uniref:anhydro-N-acetylmuramic acid kinase-like n=1 Tax=Tubulanus polymorphus TaxID=672921 RepID=UPI003DA3DE49
MSVASYHGIGLMSGNSLDGLDICYAEFLGNPSSDVWSYRIIKVKTIDYSEKWWIRLKNSHRTSGPDLIKLHADFGRFIGQEVKSFIESEDIKELDFVACNGHTAFHQPGNGLSFSLGDGERIVTFIDCPLVTNFRGKDIELGGHGRPLVAMADPYLYQEYDFCLNLGGFAYMSFEGKAHDICPCNMLLNYLARIQNESALFDKDGELAKSGEILAPLRQQLNSITYYKQSRPKSLCREWFDKEVLPLLDYKTWSIKDMLRTSVAHIIDEICQAVELFLLEATSVPAPRAGGKRKMLVTGGGAHNLFLVKCLTERLSTLDVKIVEYDRDEYTLDYKEALVYAFLGMRCLLGLPNISKDVTGGKDNIVAGSIHVPPHHSKPVLSIK